MPNQKQNYTPAELNAIGGNPHAETPARADYRDLDAWIVQHIGLEQCSSPGAIEARDLRAFHAVDALLELGETLELAPLILLLARVSSRRMRFSGSRWISLGGLALPASPQGVATLQRIRQEAQGAIAGSNIFGTIDSTSALGDLLESCANAHGQPGFSGLQNRTIPSEIGFRFGLSFMSRPFQTLPEGMHLPAQLLSTPLEGREIDDPMELKRHMDACDDGTADFLREFNIDFEQVGAYECSECGTEHESEEAGDILQIDEFSLTEKMVEYAETQGFGGPLREYLDAERAPDLPSLLESFTDAEILERCAPDMEGGIRFDPAVWRYEPDFSTVEGADDMDGSAAIEAGALLGKIVASHTGAGVLPPIGGRLHYVPAQHEALSTIVLSWDPDMGYLEYAIGSRLALRINARTGARVIMHEPSTEDPDKRFTVALERSGSEWCFGAGAGNADAATARLLAIFQGAIAV